MKINLLEEERIAAAEGTEEGEGDSEDGMRQKLEELRGQLEEKKDELDLQSDQLRTVTYLHYNQTGDVKTAMEACVEVQ